MLLSSETPPLRTDGLCRRHQAEVQNLKMADPLSITTGVIALLGTCITVATAIKGFYDGAAIADVKVKGLLSDVESLPKC